MGLGHAAGREEPERDGGAELLQILDDAVQLLPQVPVRDPPLARPPPPAQPEREPPRRAEHDVFEVGRDDDAPPALLLPGAELEGGYDGPELRPVARRVVDLASRSTFLQGKPDRSAIVIGVVLKRESYVGTVPSWALVCKAATARWRVGDISPVPVVDATPIDKDQYLATIVPIDEARLR